MDILEKINSGKIKGYLTINERIIFEGAIYHITQRAPGREILFVEDKDYLQFLKLLKETAKKFKLDLFCFSLLPNHLHLLLKINEENLSKAMKNLFERYADYFNKKYERKGHVFCGRYRASLCNDENYLIAASVYIHLNPYHAKLCEAFSDWRWSSIDLYIKPIKESFVNFKEILSLLGSSLEKARERYMELLKESVKIEGSAVLEGSYIKKLVRRFVRIVKGKKEGLEEVVKKFRKRRVVKEEDKNARKYLIEQLLANGYSLEEIGKALSISRATLYRILHS
jgi:putative transposase